MKVRSCLLLFAFVIGVLLMTVSSLRAQSDEFVHHFDYNRQAPLGLKEIGVERRGGVAIHDITFTSPKGGVVPA